MQPLCLSQQGKLNVFEASADNLDKGVTYSANKKDETQGFRGLRGL